MSLEIKLRNRWPSVVNYDTLKSKLEANPTTSRTGKVSEELETSKYNM